MEEEKFSPEQSEEVIELLDIVGDSALENNAEQESEGVFAADSDRRGDAEAGSADTGEDPAGDDVVLLDEDDVVSEKKEAPENTELTAQPTVKADLPESVDEAQPAISDADNAEAQAEAEAQGGRVESSSAAEEDHRAEIQRLEERVAALEKANAELGENLESLSQQIAHVGSMFLEDASVRLNMEEMVSRMLDARLPSQAEQEEGGAEESGVEARLEALEKRVQDWEAQSEHQAAVAAARVIREEIAAMRAESSGSPR